MALSTLAGVIAGLVPPVHIGKTGVTACAIGIPHSTFYEAGIPAPAAASAAGVNGAALTTYAGQIPFPNGSGLDTYLARYDLGGHTNGSVLLCDRLWHNSGLDVTSNGSQAITSPTWPARDRDGSTEGDEVFIGMEVSTVMGSGTPTLTLGYTNQAGADSKTAVTAAITTTSPVGTFWPFPLAAGDTGVRSIQSVQFSATMTSGAVHLVAYRIIARLRGTLVADVSPADVFSGALPRMYENSVPFLVRIPSSTGAVNLLGSLHLTQV